MNTVVVAHAVGCSLFGRYLWLVLRAVCRYNSGRAEGLSVNVCGTKLHQHTRCDRIFHKSFELVGNTDPGLSGIRPITSEGLGTRSPSIDG